MSIISGYHSHGRVKGVVVQTGKTISGKNYLYAIPNETQTLLSPAKYNLPDAWTIDSLRNIITTLENKKIEDGKTVFLNFFKTYRCFILDDPLRKKLCDDEFSRIGIPPVYYKADNGKNLDRKKLEKKKIIHKNMVDEGNNVRPGVMGLCSTTYRCWKEIADSCKEGSDEDGKFHLILEDDFLFHPDFMKLLPEYLSNVPKDCEYLQLGCATEGPGMNGSVTDMFYNSDMVNRYFYRITSNVSCTHAYAITPACARKLIKTHTPFKAPVDYIDLNTVKMYSAVTPDSSPEELYVTDQLFKGMTHYFKGLCVQRKLPSQIGHGN